MENTIEYVDGEFVEHLSRKRMSGNTSKLEKHNALFLEKKN